MQYLKPLFLTLIAVIIFSNAQGQTDSTSTNTLYNHILSLDSTIRNDLSKQTTSFNPTDTSSLPIGIVTDIGGVKYAICIDSARFSPTGAEFSVYMAMDFPGAGRKIAFAAKNIKFNPKGVLVSQGTRLKLVSQDTVNLGPNASLIFKNDGGNFINWNCEGYQSCGLSLDFLFNPNVIINATSPGQPVKASFTTVITNLQDLYVTIPSVDDFYVKGAEDFTFSLTNLVLDRSASMNPPGVALPSITSQLYNGNINEWKGFYAGNFAVTLDDKLSKTGQETKIYATNLIIDDAGVSGAFGATNLFSTSEGEMSGWGFSITNIQVDIEANHLIGGSMAGKIQLPVMNENSLSYVASIDENPNYDKLDYFFSMNPTDTMSFQIPAFKSKININPSSNFSITVVNGDFKPKAILNGLWTYDSNKGKIKSIAYQDLTFVTEAPYITQGLFSLTSSGSNSDNNLMKFPISISQIGFNTNTQNELMLRAMVGLTIGDSANGFSVNTGLNVVSKTEPNLEGRTTLAYDKITVDDITFAINTTPFNLSGVISVRNDDPVFGDLFYGSISFKLNDVMNSPMMVSAGFGKFPAYKYWYVDASVPVNIPIGGDLAITNLYGGVSSRVTSTLTDTQLIDRVIGNITVNPGAGAVIPFVPNPNAGLIFRAGVGLESTSSEEAFNGEAILTVALNSSGGLAYINFVGNAYMMVKRSERTNPSAPKAYGSISMNYDNVGKIFDASVDAAILVPGKLTGNANLKIHVDQNDWYFWLNRPQNRATVSLIGLFSANAYFQIGSIIDPLPPPPAYVTNIVGAGGLANIDLTSVSMGNGFLTGMQFNAGFSNCIGITNNWDACASANFGGGFDLILTRMSPTAHCVGSSDPIGINRWYCMGQVYAYINGSLGAQNTNNGNTVNLISINAACLLQGRLPKPTFVYGAIGLQFSFLTINFNVTVDAEVGNNCQIVN